MSIQLKEVSEWVGKTISHAEISYDYLLLRFEDGSYAKVTKQAVPYEDYDELVTDRSLDLGDQLQIGLIDRAEYNRQLQVERDRQLAASREWKKQQFERLRQELGE